jgi:hypothetical protein
MPKADAMGLAPEKSAALNPRHLSVPGVFAFGVNSYFSGEVSERRPWAYKREDRPKGVPNSALNAREQANRLTSSPADNLRISRENIVTRYTQESYADGR